MPDCPSFRLYVGDNVAAVVADLYRDLQRQGGSASLIGDAGSFALPLPIGGSIQGNFSIDGTSVKVSIASRPAAVSCGIIESKLQDMILDAKVRLKRAK
jgi:hypothetical protein